MVSPVGVPCGISFWDSAISTRAFPKLAKFGYCEVRNSFIDDCESLLSPLGDVYIIVPLTTTRNDAQVIKSSEQPIFFLTMMKVIVLATGIPLLIALAVRAFDRWDFSYNAQECCYVDQDGIPLICTSMTV